MKLFAAVIVSELEETALCPFAVTVTEPVAAPVGITNDKLVAAALETDAGIAPPPCWLNVTVGVALFPVKFVPLTVTTLPTDADVGLKLVMVGPGGSTVKVKPLLATPPTVTTTLPVVAPDGTGAMMLVALQVVGVAAVPLNVTVLDP